MIRIELDIPGSEKLEALIKEHYRLVELLSDNLCEMFKAKVELETKMNQPAATD